MDTRTRPISAITAPIALLALAAAMPLVVAGEAAGGGSTVTAATNDQAQTIARVVNEAARRFCGLQAALPLPNAFVVIEPLVEVGTVRARPLSRPGVTSLSPSLIDMPPPVR